MTGGDPASPAGARVIFLREGADVVINHLPQEEPDAREVLDIARQENRKCLSMPGDLQDQGFCQKLVEDAARELGGLDVLVINAARQTAQKSIDDITPSSSTRRSRPISTPCSG